MSRSNSNQVWLDKIDDKALTLMVSTALREEHRNDTSVTKMIGQNTGCSLHTINKWIQCKNSPKSAHLLSLAGVYPLVLKVLLEVICRTDVWDRCVSEKIVQKMYAKSVLSRSVSNVYRDKVVTINIVASIEVVDKLNLRQVWCLSELQKGRKLKTVQICDMWDVSNRTAKRDIRNLLKIGLVQFVGARKDGFYVLKRRYLTKH